MLPTLERSPGADCRGWIRPRRIHAIPADVSTSRPPARLLWLLVVLASVSVSAPASAQLHRATDPVMTPASSLASHDDALSIDVNPAALGLLPGASFAYLHSEVDKPGSWLGRGDAVYLSVPILGKLSLATSLQSIRPGGNDLVVPVAQADRSSAAFAIALSDGRRSAIALTTRAFMSGDSRFDGLGVVDLAAMFRPTTVFEFGIVGRDLFATRFGRGTTGLDLASTLMLNAGLRPFGTDVFGLDGAVALDFDSHIDARFSTSLRMPYLGRVSGVLELIRPGERDATTRALVELAMSWGAGTIAAGGLSAPTGDAIGGAYALLRVDGLNRAGIPAGRYIADLQLSGVDARRMIEVTLWLDRAGRDPAVAGVLLRPRGSGLGRAGAQELRLQIGALRRAGKRVVCHLESASGDELYACAAADLVLVDPAGSGQLLGTGSTVVLYGDTIRKLGVRADFLRIGDYKSAAEQLAQGEMSEASRAQLQQLLDDVHLRLVADLSDDLGIDRVQVAALIDEGMHLAPQLVERGLSDGMADLHELKDDEDGSFEGLPVRSGLPERWSRRWGVPARVGMVVVDGTIVDGENVDIPLLDIHMSGGETVARAIDGMASDPTVAAIVLRVDSPGGAVVASDQIWRAVSRARRRKPVVASMGSVAASGGYYAACAADEIWADPSTLTGSIGIFAGKVDIEALSAKIGLGVEEFRRGAHQGADSVFRPFSAADRARLAGVLRQYYRQFVERVAEGRGMDFASVDALARGRVYTGDRAREVGLVDRLGGLSSALQRARVLGGLPPGADVLVRPKRPEGLLDYVLKEEEGDAPSAAALATEAAASVGKQQTLQLPAELRRLSQIVARGMLAADGAPLALMPYDLQL